MIFIFPILVILCAFFMRRFLGKPHFLGEIESSTSEATTNISVIIPARNEETNIGPLLESLNDQAIKPYEIIVVDDHSEDDTARVAEQHGARVINPPPLPDDWLGKPWACHQGAAAAKGAWLLFLDSDTRLEHAGMEKFAALIHDERAVHSVCPYHVIKKPYEGLSAFFNVIMIAGTGAFGAHSKPQNNALFGQCMLVSKSAYDLVEGHSSVRSQPLENFHLAKTFGTHDIARYCYLGKGVIRMRMFPEGLSALIASWKKGFVSGATTTDPTTLRDISIWISGGMLAIVSFVTTLTPFSSLTYQLVTSAAYLIYAIQCYRTFRLIGTFSIFNALYFPVSLLFYQSVFFSALIDKKRGAKIQWKGRELN